LKAQINFNEAIIRRARFCRPEQTAIEADFRRELKSARYDLYFNNFNIMPVASLPRLSAPFKTSGKWRQTRRRV